MKTYYSCDIYTYIVIGAIDKRNGKIEGHEIILSKEQLHKIEDIVTSTKIIVNENKAFDLEIKK